MSYEANGQVGTADNYKKKHIRTFCEDIIRMFRHRKDQQNSTQYNQTLENVSTYPRLIKYLAMKYGVVPSEIMPETYSSNNTSQMASQLKNILRQGGLKLRDVYDASGAV